MGINQRLNSKFAKSKMFGELRGSSNLTQVQFLELLSRNCDSYDISRMDKRMQDIKIKFFYNTNEEFMNLYNALSACSYVKVSPVRGA